MLWSFFWETGKRVFFGKWRKGTFGVFKLRILDIDRKVWNGRMIVFQETMFGQPPGLGILENGLVSGNMEIQIMPRILNCGWSTDFLVDKMVS
ncbi:uncharacterized protein OCT59_008435 [Rhizophagus irregularis]|uniref:uncharacterized protein n=1 Tax=Rhizophagus irregularis TaxID=588596 RepID=UPI00332FCF53|nr:hypothetical protein OCT59_008435 [Rhizophagus irregularis]